MRRAMRLGIGALLLLLAGAWTGISAATADGPSPEPLPPEGRFTYAVLRHDDEVGTLTVAFDRSEDGLVVRSRMEIVVTWLSLPVYRFRHEAEEQWVDGRLAGLRSRTNDNGKARRVELRRDGDRLRGTYNRETRDLPATLLPATFWHPDTVHQSALLDPIKGRSRRISVVDRGEERIAVGGESVPTRRFSITGQIKREVWYGSEGQLLQVRFPAKDGSEITLVLRSVSADPDGA